MTVGQLVLVLLLSPATAWDAGPNAAKQLPSLADHVLWWTLVPAGIIVASLAGASIFWKNQRQRHIYRPEVSSADVSSEQTRNDNVSIKSILRCVRRDLANPSSPATVQRASRLPLFLVIGPAGSGKTSWLRNCGLTTQPLSEYSSGSVGSDIAKVWLINEATFLDVDGQFFDSDPKRLARLLHSLRLYQFGPWSVLVKRSPWHVIRGIIVVLDVNEFIGVHDPSKQHRAVKHLRDRLGVVGAEFGGCPVYVVFAKADGLPYFAEFVSGMAEHDCQQVFGVLGTDLSRPSVIERQSAETETKRVNDYVDSLLRRLNDRRLLELFRESDPKTKRAIYEFPREFRRLGSFVTEVLVGAFAPSPVVPLPFLRGFFFSGIKKLEVSDRCSELTEPWSQPQESVLASEATYFLRHDATDLLRSSRTESSSILSGRVPHKWVFTRGMFETVLALDRPAWFAASIEARNRRRRLATRAITLSLVLCMGAAWTLSWLGNRKLIGSTQAAILNVQRGSDQLGFTNLQSLEILRQQVDDLSAPKGWQLHAGLFIGNRLLPVARRMYFQRLKVLVLSKVQSGLRDRLLRFGAGKDIGQSLQDYILAFTTLRTYLFMSRGACSGDRVEINHSLDDVARIVFPALAQEERPILRNQLDFYSQTRTSDGSPFVTLDRDDRAVTLARAYLREGTGANQQLQRVLNEINAQTRPLVIGDVVPDFRSVLFGSAVLDGAFTKPGREMFERQSGKATWDAAAVTCVMGGKGDSPGELPDRNRIVKELRSAYYRRYADAWRRVLTETRVSSFRGPVDAARRLEILSGAGSPILAALRIVALNTAFSPEGSDALQVAAGSLGSAYDVTKLFQPVMFVTPPGLHTLVNENNVQYVQALRNLGESLDSLGRSSSTQSPTTISDAKKAVARARGSLYSVADKFSNFRSEGLNREVADFLAQPIQLADRIIPR